MTTAPRLYRPLRLGHLTPLDGTTVRPEDSCDSVRIGVDGTVGLLDWSGCSFFNCAIESIGATRLAASSARCSGVRIEAVTAPHAAFDQASLLSAEIRDSRFGAMEAMEATMHSLLVERCRIDYLNLRMARCRDVVFRGCLIGDFDAADAQLERVAFEDCEIRSLTFRHARIRDVDLRGARLTEIRNAEALAGVTMTPGQVADLAQAFARHLGVRIEQAER
ncbi:pentapeptide repeat-containing protein [Bifidobacterium phasiani]|uniref:Pentapeptide repeat-containing protein n=1 Tax=Bifidobacterium phasiani TaxID=2834431 RepID=A0ABS6W7Z3_9BIFI|nr:pentapeptide repeat-containing protein [Bifidobacterium phasiani]MBW3082462.1 pentapeptide repeat-containing protein [Bifidobacterium phasiani]